MRGIAAKDQSPTSSRRQPAPSASRVALELDSGIHLHYVDPRMFGRFRLVAHARFEQLPEIAALGPDPLADGIDPAALRTRLAGLRTPIKAALLDQTLLAGVGNIQASESLFRAAIDPRRPGQTLTGPEVKRLAAAILESIHFTLDDFAAVPATRGVHFFSGALDEKPRVDYLTTLQYLGFSYHVV